MRVAATVLLLCASSWGGGGGGGSSPPPPPPPPGASTGAVWGISPFPAGCGGSGGVNYVNAEVEPHLAVDPRDANHLVGVWQQDRWSNGSSRGLLTGVSFDGGATWITRQVPFSNCSGGTAANGGDYLRATDPWVSFGADGAVYQSTIATSGGTFAAGSSNAVLVSRSADGGRTWSDPVTLIRDGSAFFSDKETITADPTDAHFAYVVWDRIDTHDQGPTYFARTIDGGATWEPARAVYDPGPGQQTIANLIRVLPDGTLVNLLARLVGTEDVITDGALEVIRSTDHGAPWSAPIRISQFRPLGARDPTTGQAIRDGSIVPQMAVAPNGTLYAVWQDARFTGTRDAIALARSTDGGLTWSAPVRVNTDPGVAAFTPQVHVRADGTIGVTYFDLRSDTADPLTLPTDYWIARSADGIAWTETRVAATFDLAGAPLAGGAFFLGDYMGLASAGTAFLPFFVRTTGDFANRTDVFMARIAATSGAAEGSPAPKRLEPMPQLERDAQFHRNSLDNLRRARDTRAMR